MSRKRSLVVGLIALGLAAAGLGQAVSARVVLAQTSTTSAAKKAASPSAVASVPRFEVDRLWPKPLPNHWIIGSVTGVAVDANDHVWIVHNGANSLTQNTEMGTGTNPPTAERCCSAAPPVLEFDVAGTLLGSWGGPADGVAWPRCVQGIGADPKGNIWLAGNAPETKGNPPRACQFGPGGSQAAPVSPAVAAARGATPAPAAARGAAPAPAAGGARGGRGNAAATGPVDTIVARFSSAGEFLRQIGIPGKAEGPASTTTLNRPANMDFDAATNEIYVADTGNRRIVVFDADSGVYKRHWGAYGNKPEMTDLPPYDPALASAPQFRSVSCVRIARDGTVYVCDKVGDRIQAFHKDGQFVRETLISNTTGGGENGGSVWDIAFSRDPQQRYMYVADGHDKKVFIVQRSTMTVVGSIGTGGRLPGEFVGVGSLAVDSKGNLYTGETFEGKRVQKWILR